MSEWDKEFNDKLKEKISSFSETPPPGLWDRVMAGLPEDPVPAVKKYSRSSLILALGLIALSSVVLKQDAFNFFEPMYQKDKIQAANLDTPKIENENNTIASSGLIKSSTPKNQPISVKADQAMPSSRNSSGGSKTNKSNYLSTSKFKVSDRRNASKIISTGLVSSTYGGSVSPDEAKGAEPVYLSDHVEHQSGHGVAPRRIEPSLSTSINEDFLFDTATFFKLNAELADSARLNDKHLSSLKWDVALVGGPNIGYRSMSSQVHADVVSHRNAHEKSSVNYNAGLEVGMKYKKLRLSLGFGYFERGEHYFFQGQNVRHEFKNKYSYLSIPLNVSYDLLIRSRFTLSPMAGYAFNILHQGQASWLNPHNHSEVHMSSKHSNPYRQSGHMLMGSVQMGYQVNRKLKVLYRVGYTHFLQSIYKPSVALDQRQYSIDHQFGIQVTLGK